MFKQARLKLTLWYLLVIMLVSMSFSVVIFNTQAKELERFERVQRVRIELFGRQQLPINTELIEETKTRLLWELAGINLSIFIFAGGFGYFLAGKTLKPIQDSVDEQNRFITDASHELKTPLTSLKSAFEVFLREKNPPATETKSLVVESLAEVNRLQTLTESLLQLERPLQIEKLTKISVNEIIQVAAQKSPIEYKKNSFAVLGDQDSLVNLFRILFDNATKYTTTKTRINVQAVKLDYSIIISVADQGIGIAQKDLPHVFDRFYRADTSRSRIAGYGLGLSIAKKIVTANNGTISVTSKLGKGSTFSVSLKQG